MDSSLTPSTNVINCHSSSVFNRQTLYTFSLIDYIIEIFRPYSNLLVRISNAGSQVGVVNFAFVVYQSIEMAKDFVANHDYLLKIEKINVESKKHRSFPRTFRPTYPTAASPTSY
ncbi:unnamed protein product [Rotaria sp. Silwood1]|nr:unnamed protein product [Rotaria sp. Silwood1]CAF1626072.1 unnamed protein product [Rotaria sp. Silwood1]CAF3755595.1 unnamed protein product [Rotaria sp. Silwood1]CAF3801130.1 unnamed protein product [Rotaria sp. Silwood1]CAF3870941.1 unnamed protein product [Rotaria sp. Silwood1]